MAATANDPINAFFGFLFLSLVMGGWVFSENAEKCTFLQAMLTGNHLNLIGCCCILGFFSTSAAAAIPGCVVAWIFVAVGLGFIVKSKADGLASKDEAEEEKADRKEKEREDRRFRYQETKEKLRSQQREIEHLKRKQVQWKHRPGDPRPPEPGEKDEGIPFFKGL